MAQDVKIKVTLDGGKYAIEVFDNLGNKLDVVTKQAKTWRDENGRLRNEFGQFVKETEDGGTRFQRAMDAALGFSLVQAAQKTIDVIGQVGQAAFEMATQAEDIEAAYHDTFRNTTDEFDRFVEEFGITAGATSAFGQDIASNIGMIGQGFGMAEEESTAFTERFLRLSRDLTSRTGKDIEQSIDSLRGVIVGNTESIREQFGISITAADIQAKALAQTGKASADALNQQDKAVAALQLAYDRAGKAVGDYERTADSTANAARRTVGELREYALDVAKGLLPIFQELTAEAGQFLSENREEIEAAIASFNKGVLAAWELIKQFSSAIGTAARFINEYKEVIALAATALGVYQLAMHRATIATKATALATNAAALAQRAFNWAMRANPIGLIVTALGVVVGLMWKFRDRVADAGAVLFDFLARGIRGFTTFLDKLRGFAEVLPSSVPGADLLKAALDRVDASADGMIKRLENGAARMRAYAQATEEAKKANDALATSTDSVSAPSTSPVTPTVPTAPNAPAKPTRDPADVERAERALQRLRLNLMQEGLAKELAQIDAEYEAKKTQIQKNFPELAETLLEELDAWRERVQDESFGIDEAFTADGTLTFDLDDDFFDEQVAAAEQAAENMAAAMEAGSQRTIEAKTKEMEAEAQLQQARAKSLGQAVANNVAQAKSVREAGNAIIDTLKREIQARLAVTIANALSSLGPAALFLGPPLAAGLVALFDRLVPKFAKGGLVEGGQQLIQVNEQGPEFVMNARATRDYRAALEAMNAGTFKMAMRPDAAPVVRLAQRGVQTPTAQDGGMDTRAVVERLDTLERAIRGMTHVVDVRDIEQGLSRSAEVNVQVGWV